MGKRKSGGPWCGTPDLVLILVKARVGSVLCLLIQEFNAVLHDEALEVLVDTLASQIITE